MNIMGCFYKEIVLQKKPRGIHLITEEIYNKCEEIKYRKRFNDSFYKTHICFNMY